MKQIYLLEHRFLSNSNSVFTDTVIPFLSEQSAYDYILELYKDSSYSYSDLSKLEIIRIEDHKTKMAIKEIFKTQLKTYEHIFEENTHIVTINKKPDLKKGLFRLLCHRVY